MGEGEIVIINEIQELDRCLKSGISGDSVKGRPECRVCDLVCPGFRKRVDKARIEWLYKNDNSLEWNEWAKRNPSKARDICIETEYFFGDKNILPRDWAHVMEKWETSVKGEAVLDKALYQPRIFD